MTLPESSRRFSANAWNSSVQPSGRCFLRTNARVISERKAPRVVDLLAMTSWFDF